MTILLASADDNLIASAQHAFAQTSSSFVVARGGLDCLEGVRRQVPDLVILDEYLPWGGVDGVLAILEQCGEAWIAETPILLLTDRPQPFPTRLLRVFPFARPSCRRKLAEVIEMFESESVAPARTA